MSDDRTAGLSMASKLQLVQDRLEGEQGHTATLEGELAVLRLDLAEAKRERDEARAELARAEAREQLLRRALLDERGKAWRDAVAAVAADVERREWALRAEADKHQAAGWQSKAEPLLERAWALSALWSQLTSGAWQDGDDKRSALERSEAREHGVQKAVARIVKLLTARRDTYERDADHGQANGDPALLSRALGAIEALSAAIAAIEAGAWKEKDDER